MHTEKRGHSLRVFHPFRTFAGRHERTPQRAKWTHSDGEGFYRQIESVDDKQQIFKNRRGQTRLQIQGNNNWSDSSSGHHLQKMRVVLGVKGKKRRGEQRQNRHRKTRSKKGKQTDTLVMTEHTQPKI